MLARPRPDGRLPAGHHRPRGRPGRPARDDRPLRADGRPGRDPRRAAGPERPADQGVARRQGRLRLQVRHALLAVDQGLRPGRRQGGLRPAERPHGRHLGPQRRHPRRAQGAGQRGRPRRDRPRAPASPRASTTCSTRTGSTASARSPAAASASGAPGRSRATRRGATSTSGGSSTTSRSRSSRAPSGSSSSRTTCDLWERVKRTINAFLLGVWRDGALFGATPDEAFYVKCDGETNPPEVDRRRPARRRDRHRAGQAGRVRHLPDRPVLGRRGRSASSQQPRPT